MALNGEEQNIVMEKDSRSLENEDMEQSKLTLEIPEESSTTENKIDEVNDDDDDKMDTVNETEKEENELETSDQHEEDIEIEEREGNEATIEIDEETTGNIKTEETANGMNEIDEPQQSVLEIIGSNIQTAADLLPLNENWWNAAPAMVLEPITPEELILLVSKIKENDDANQTTVLDEVNNVDGGNTGVDDNNNNDDAGGDDVDDDDDGGGGGNLAQKQHELEHDIPLGIRTAIKRLLIQPYDMEAWKLLVDESKTHKWKRREILIAATKQFPTSGQCWVDYIAYELTRKDPNQNKIDKLCSFAMSLTGNSNLDLWMLQLQRSLELYEDACSDLNHALAEFRQADIDVMTRANQARKMVTENFEKCLARVGFDYGSGGLWMRYADFVRSWPNELDTKDQGQPETGVPKSRMMALRDIYQRACALPLRKVNELWKQYENFERREVENNESLGIQLLEKHRNYYKAASNQARERSYVWDPPEHLNSLTAKYPCPPLSALVYEDSSGLWSEDPLQVLPCRDVSHKSRRISEQENLVSVWTKRCKFESANKERLPFQEARNRAIHTFEQCVAAMRYYPECWHQYAQFELNNVNSDMSGKEDSAFSDLSDMSKRVARAGAIYRRALVAIPGCTLLYVAYAECMETVGELDGARGSLVSLVKMAPSSGLAWALLQKFIRRTDGVRPARLLFKLTKKARDNDELGYPLYLAHCLMEWHCNASPSIALKVFEHAAGKHPLFMANPEFALAYAECTIAASSGNVDVCKRDVRSIYERAISTMKSLIQAFHQARTQHPNNMSENDYMSSSLEWRGIIQEPGPGVVWSAYMRFEVLQGTNVSDGKRLLELEQRMFSSLPQSDIIALENVSFSSSSSSSSNVKYLSQKITSSSSSSSLSSSSSSRRDRPSTSSSFYSRSDPPQLQRLWWRHAPPGIDPLSCATQTDAAFYSRCFKNSPKENPLQPKKTASWSAHARNFRPLLRHVVGANTAADQLKCTVDEESPLWLQQFRLNEQASPALRQEENNNQLDPSSSTIATNSLTAITAALDANSTISSSVLEEVVGKTTMVNGVETVGDGEVDIPLFLRPLFMLLPKAASGQRPDIEFLLAHLLDNPILERADTGMSSKRDRLDEAEDFQSRQKQRN